ncbi:E3 ubiquitin-protein ligase NHLRC1 [Varanus komodoensis]|uniref:RING-type E3 ubiquitin transferase n=1 Tax=Varanus komodoensis TaxID=61221 RepID=A0A8D2JJT7_VARKO|nr:E3 ubiquitin-protein ligase NHLRC1 [Varanus komodoensis]XP_044282398.1 E3 ubiquitin-protein ligase NHLRC1 [Varanus komodoensis]XP_044282399.1 E3 ubiquitin-protein ligase NHLRC1 [Varanus komodoensis]XP_044282400.1 E3 ubiquitin-protein ligase NHLRC1 [Varanus komodoensis]XP_044282402.1 E3 ubiquitin-protein ligase NHLRC1 [Varanus komodoensis]XP_044282403.1 E3 ubiquitin-protein ligase NHLRC1 [Varanus komodoensis]XP_044282404.1 E3 ubiquitin-protein ligase NHLRC1 [Varanus komodoensis]KAF7245273.
MSAKASKDMQTMTELLDQAEDSLLECKVCFEKYNQQKKHRPRNLPCGHVICLECVMSLAHPRNLKLECPFCREVCKSSETSDCLPLLHLMEILSPSANNTPVLGRTIGIGEDVAIPASQSFVFRLSFGGWGALINPTGMAVCQRTGCVAVAHDGKKRIKLFTFNGDCLQQFGERGQAGNDIRYPTDITITLDGHIVVTDSGDRSVKVFDFNGRGKLLISESFSLPWGLDTTPQNDLIMTDSEAGTLYRLTADFKKGELKEVTKLYSNLCNPRKVAVSQASGALAVIEHLMAKEPNYDSTRVKIFSADLQLISQVDSFGLNLVFPSKIYASDVTFSREGHIMVTDTHNQTVLCLGKPEEFPVCRPIITSGLSYPLALTYTADNSLIVLDGGDHSLKVYTCS